MLGGTEHSGVFQPTTFATYPTELDEWITAPSWLLHQEVREKIFQFERSIAIRVPIDDTRPPFNLTNFRQSLCSVLMMNPKRIEGLSLSGCPVEQHITGDTVIPAAAAMMEGMNHNTPNVSEAWEFLCQSIALCVNITVIDLQMTHMDELGAAAVTNWVVPYCKSLRELNLSDNPDIGDTEIYRMADVMAKERCVLERFGLRKVGLNHVSDLCGILSHLPYLCQVDLTMNPFPVGEYAVNALAALDNVLRETFTKMKKRHYTTIPRHFPILQVDPRGAGIHRTQHRQRGFATATVTKTNSQITGAGGALPLPPIPVEHPSTPINHDLANDVKTDVGPVGEVRANRALSLIGRSRTPSMMSGHRYIMNGAIQMEEILDKEDPDDAPDPEPVRSKVSLNFSKKGASGHLQRKVIVRHAINPAVKEDATKCLSLLTKEFGPVHGGENKRRSTTPPSSSRWSR